MDDFAARLESALGRPLGAGEPLAVAVSGGPDSIALLQIAVAAFPGRVTALTVDHGLRIEAADEAADVARQCADAGIAHHILRWLGDKPTANLQAEARRARYRLLAGWCAAHDTSVLMTGHHADDQAETLLLRLARGSGSSGLAGIRVRRDLGQGVVLLRPLLGIRRADLAGFIGGWRVVDDPANRDPRHDRTHARRVLAETPWLDVQHLADAAAHLADTETAMAWTADLAWAGHAGVATDAIDLDIGGLPGALVFRLTARAITALNPVAAPRGPDLQRLIARLHAGGTGTIAGVKASGGTVWHFRIAPPRRQNG